MSELAASQLAELAAYSQGAIELLATSSQDDGSTTFTISLDTRGIQTSGDGIRVRARERFDLLVGPSFPFKHPSVMVQHRRWAGTPHVQWGRILCLYAAPSVEWNPVDGMRGLIARLNLWLQRAAEGTLDPDGQPLHPPVAYSSSAAGWIIINPDLGDRTPWHERIIPGNTSLLYAWCRRKGKRVDIVEWLAPLDVYDRVLDEDFVASDDAGLPYFVAPLLLISDELGMEYPSSAAALAASLEQSGVSSDDLLHAFTSAGTLNRAICAMATADGEAPTIVLLGTPARRVEGERRLAHVTAWKLDDLGSQITSLLGKVQRETGSELAAEVRDLANDWLGFADTSWMVVYENRPEVTRRRDTGSAAAWLTGKRVLLLGCGALGAPIAEQCVRAGVADLTVADKSVVSPGILVRQPYVDSDIGYGKARMLANRLNQIRRDLVVKHEHGDVIAKFLTADSGVPDFDLVIDATADVGVRTALESAHSSSRHAWPPVVAAVFGHEATRGIVVVSRTGATGTSHDILRRLAIDSRAAAGSAWSDIADDFFPDPPRTQMFFPEPGCSAPTFTGSAIQAAGLASALFWAAIVELSAEDRSRPMVAFGVRLPGSGMAPSSVSELVWPNDVLVTEIADGLEVRLSQRAAAEIRAEVRRGARVRGSQIETGGMLLGSIDEATRTIYIDVATGPTPDSALSNVYFKHGIQGTQEILEHHRITTANRVGFMGIWHTHPYGRASPSLTDEAGMASLVAPDGTGRRALMLILGGSAHRWQAWHDDGELPDMYARIVHRRPGDSDHGLPHAQTAPPGNYYPGGYGFRDELATLGDEHHWWQLFGGSH